MNENIIEEIMREISHQSYSDWSIFTPTVKEIVEQHLSEKIILDKKVLEDMIEKRDKAANFLYWKSRGWMTEDRITKDLQSLLPKD